MHWTNVVCWRFYCVLIFFYFAPDSGVSRDTQPCIFHCDACFLLSKYTNQLNVVSPHWPTHRRTSVFCEQNVLLDTIYGFTILLAPPPPPKKKKKTSANPFFFFWGGGGIDKSLSIAFHHKVSLWFLFFPENMPLTDQMYTCVVINVPQKQYTYVR